MSSSRGKEPLTPESPIDRLLREERDRRKLFEQATGGSLAKMAALGSEHALAVRKFDSVLGGPTFRALREITEQQQRIADSFRAFITPEYLQTLQATARAITESFPQIAVQTYELSDSLRSTLRGLTKAFEVQGDAFRSLSQQPSWLEAFAAISAAAAAMQPTLEAFAHAAESQWNIEAAAVPATEDQTASQVIAVATTEANQALLSLLDSEAPQELIHFITSFFQALGRLFDHFKANTVKEVQEAGFFFLISTALVFADVLDRIDGTSLGREDRTQLEQVQGNLHQLREQLAQVETLSKEADTKFVNRLPKAEVRSHANVRFQPSQSSKMIQRLRAGDEVAVAERRGSWRGVIYRDPLTAQLARGWVYKSSLALM